MLSLPNSAGSSSIWDPDITHVGNISPRKTTEQNRLKTRILFQSAIVFKDVYSGLTWNLLLIWDWLWIPNPVTSFQVLRLLFWEIQWYGISEYPWPRNVPALTKSWCYRCVLIYLVSKTHFCMHWLACHGSELTANKATRAYQDDCFVHVRPRL